MGLRLYQRREIFLFILHKCVQDKSYLKRSAIRHEIEYEREIGKLKIKSFRIPHDSRQNVGYIITDGEDTFGLATDMGHVTEEIAYRLRECRCVVLEANHDIEMLKNGQYPEFLKSRILSENGHLSNKNSARLACYLAENGVKCLTLAHLSKENNTPALAYDTVRELLSKNDLEIDLAVASPSEATLATR